MNANQINAMFRAFNVGVRINKGDGYYYWSDLNGGLLDVESVYVYRASQIDPEVWLLMGREIEQISK